MTNKQKLVENLYEMSTLSADQFKSRAYNNAARIISEMEENEYNERKSFLDIKGIGTSINSKILEFRQSEQMPCLDKLREEQKTFLDNTIYKVRKNTMMKRAFEGTEFAALDEYLDGPSAIAISKDDATAPARIICKFAEKAKKLEVKAGMVDGEVYDVDGVKALSKVPSREFFINGKNS